MDARGWAGVGNEIIGPVFNVTVGLHQFMLAFCSGALCFHGNKSAEYKAQPFQIVIEHVIGH